MNKRKKVKKKKKIMKKILIIVVVLIILLVGGFFFWIETHTNKSNSSTTKEQITNRIQDEDVKNSIFKDYYKEATKVVSKMTLEEKVGQLFLVRYDKNEISTWNEYNPGGYLLFAKDFENHNKESIKIAIITPQIYKKILNIL